MKRLKDAIRKLLFCISISASPASTLRLMVNTKFPSRYGSSYRFILEGQNRQVYLRGSKGDIAMFYSVFLHQVYRLPDAVFRSAGVIVDLGAHIGMTALYFALNSRATIYSMEPDADNYRLLLLNAPDRAVPIHAAIADKSTVYLQKNRWGYNTKLSDNPTPFGVRGMSLRDMLEEYQIRHIDVLKVDIEGAEEFLLKDLCWTTITQHMLIELHNKELEAGFIEVWKEYGFTVERRPLENENIFYAYKN